MIRSVISGDTILHWWWVAMIVAGLAVGIGTGFFKARKIQPKGFKWKIFRNEAIFAAITLLISGAFLGWVQKELKQHGIITFRHEPAQWWVIALEYAAYFFGFDTWFYWLHRWMHNEPVYSWVHKLHHRSTSPNLLTTLSVHPFESLINGGWLLLFTSVFAVHDQAMLLMAPTTMIMGPYVHSGYEFLPRWWNRTWASKWFITATFHDQHHKYFTINYGGYTTIWDRLCGTMRPKYEAEFEKLTTRGRGPALVPVES